MQLKDIDLNLLIAFEALVRECHVTRASVRLEISQSSMSLALAKLRVLFQDPLLVKAGNGLTPTAKALHLLPRIEELLRAADALIHEQRAFDPSSSTDTIKLIVIDYIDFVVVPALMDVLTKQAPGIQLQIIGPNPAKLGEDMRSGQVDGALSYFPNPPNSIRCRRLFTDRLVAVARRGHPALKTRMTVHDFCNLKHITIVPAKGATMYNALVDDALAEEGLRRNVVLSKPTFMGVPFIIDQTDLVAILPKRVAHRFTQMLPIEMFDLPCSVDPFNITMMWHDRTHHTPLHKWFRDLVLEVCQQL